MALTKLYQVVETTKDKVFKTRRTRMALMTFLLEKKEAPIHGMPALPLAEPVSEPIMVRFRQFP
jgi:hypothetical protein